MFETVSYKKTLVLDRSGFQKLSDTDIEKIQNVFDVVFPDILLAEIFNPSKENMKQYLEEKLLKFEYIWVFLHTETSSFCSFHGIYSNLESVGHYGDIALTCISPQEILDSPVRFTWLRDSADASCLDPNRRPTMYCIGGSDNRLTFNDMIDRISEDDNINKDEIKEWFMKIGSPGTSQEPHEIARSADIQIAIADENPETLDELNQLVIKAERLKLKYNKMKIIDQYVMFQNWMINYLILGEASKMKGLDKSYYNDFIYVFYAPFCDLFVTQEKTFPMVLEPVSDRFNFLNFLTFDDFRDKFLKRSYD